MDIIVVGSNRAERARGFQEHLQARDWSVQMSPIDGPLPRVGKPPAGIVLFADGAQGVSEWVARVEAHTRYLSVPLVAVAHDRDPVVQNQLLAAGACAVFDADVDDDRLLAELQARCDAQPVFAEIRENLLQPFTDATTVTLQEMAGVTVIARAVYQKAKYKMFGDTSAVIGLMAPREGSLVLSFPQATANAVVERILAGITDQLDSDMIRDCIGEVANVIAGQAKGVLASTKYQFCFSTPTIIAGAGHEIRHKPDMPCLVIAFTSDVGDFALQLCLHL